MFRLVDLQLTELSKYRSPKDILREIDRLPKTLYSFYEHTILQIDEQKDREFAQRALHWISSSPRPVSLQELAEAVIVRPDDEGQCYVDEDDRIGEDALLEILPAGLVTTYTKEVRRPIKILIGERYELPEPNIMTSMVQFAHFSVQEYLQSDNILRGRVSEFHLDPTASNIQSTESCFAYLLFMGSQKPELTVEIFQRFPLFDYARACWPYHFNEIEMLSEHAKPSSTSRSYILALGFLKGDSEAWKLSTTLEIFDYSKKQNDEISWLGTNEKRLRRIVDGQPVLVLGNGAMEPTSFLSLLGFESLLEKILSVTPRSTISASGYSKDDISNKDYLRPPLHNAALGGHVNTVRILLKYGFYVNQRGGLGDSPLHVACIEGNLEVAHILLEAGADVDIKDGHGHPVLLYPCYKNDVALTRLLLEAGADVNAKTSKGIPALLVTVAREVIEMASLLLEFGADVNCRGTSPGTPLETAAQAGDTRMVDLLLRNGADTLGRQRTDWLEEVYTAELRDAVTVRYLQAIDELKFKKKLAWEETKFLSNDSWESILILAEEERDKLERRISDLEETKTVYRYNKYTVKEQEERIRMLRDVRARLRGPDSAAT